MDQAGYVTLTRQSGLLREMQIVANNIANAATTGYRQEGLVFSELIQRQTDAPSVSMAHAHARGISMVQGSLTQTGGRFDLAIEGEGFFLLSTPDGERLTRAGSFSPNANGELVSHDGHQVLDAGGTPVFVPLGVGEFSVAADGTLSADGVSFGQIGLFAAKDPELLRRDAQATFIAETGVEPANNGQILQGYLEGSNVDAITQLTRMIEVQRAYEMGQSFLDSEDDRIRAAIKSMTR